MRHLSALCAAAVLGLTGFAATSPAQAAFHLIRWQGTGFCQVWDQSIPTTPFPTNYRTVSRPVATLGQALAVKDGMVKRGACKM